MRTEKDKTINQEGASLVELLATIAIIGTVAGISTPMVMHFISEAEAKAEIYSLRVAADTLRYAVIDEIGNRSIEEILAENLSGDFSYVLQKERPQNKPFEIIVLDDTYYLTLP